MFPVKSPEELSARNTGKKDKVVVEKDKAEELPPGWTKEVKTRKSGSAAKVDRYYTDPVTGYIFRSLRDAQRYLKTGELGRLAIKPKKNECLNKDERLHMEEREERSELKEHMSESLRCRPSDNRRSKLSESGKSELLHLASKRLAGINTDAPPLSLPEPKTRQASQLAAIKVDMPPQPSPLPPGPKTRQAARLARVLVDAPSPSPSPTKLKTCKATRQAGRESDSPPPSSPDTRTSCLTTCQAGVKIDSSVASPPAPKTFQAARQSEIKIDSPPPSSQDSDVYQTTLLVGTGNVPLSPSQLEPKTRQAKRVPGIRDDESPVSLPQPRTRRATRQAGVKVDSRQPSPLDTRTNRQAKRARLVNLAIPRENEKRTEVEKITNKHNEIADMDNNLILPVNQENNEKQEKHKVFPAVSPKEHYKKIEMGSSTLLAPEDQTPCTVVPSVNFAEQELPVVNTVASNPEGDMKSDSSIGFSMNNLWTDPCIEFAVKTLTGVIPLGDLNRPENAAPSPLKVPLEELWTDPCIEFAVKTLTGAIPVGEDDYLQHQPSSSRSPRAPHDFFLPDVGMSFCQTDVSSSHFERGQNKQQESAVPTYGSGGSQKLGNIVNGECSRSRFFQ